MSKSRAEQKANRKTDTYEFSDAASLLDLVFSYRYFHAEGKTPAAIPYFWQKGLGNLVVIVGENASGKSFVRRIVTGVCQRAKVECIRISMEGRNGHFGGMRGFIYGDESYNSTGHNSANTVLTGIRTCRGRETPHVMFWDEPDLGLSDSWAAGMGAAIAEFAEQPGKHTRAIFVVTHSKALVGQLLEMKKELHYVIVGEEYPPQDLAIWWDQESKPRDLSKLPEEAHKRFLAIQKILDELKDSPE